MGLRYLGNIIRPGYNPLASNITTGVNTAQYQGVFTLQQQAQAQNTQTWTTDLIFDYTTLLLQSDNAANGAQNNTFIDSSSNSFAITRNGNTTQGSFTPFSQSPGYWGNYFGGSDALTIPSTAALTFGTGDFCVEFWLYRTGTSTCGLFSNSTGAGGGDAQFEIQLQTTTTYISLLGWNTVFMTGVTPINTNTWYHIAVVRSGTSMAMFVNGKRDATATSANNFSSANGFNIGRQATGTGNLTGYISNLRAVKGSSVYSPASTSIAIPLDPLTAITNTSLLTCQSNRFVDNSSNAFVVTTVGTPSVQAFSPFAPQFQWTPSVIGGSGFFDGTGDYLTLPVNSAFDLGTNACCIEAWVYPLNTSAIGIFCTTTGGSGQTRPNFYVTTTAFQADFFGSVFFSGSATIPLNSWNHVVFTRAATNGAWRFFLNGVLTGYNATGTQNLLQTTVAQTVGFYAGTSANAYISNVRVINGSVPTSYQTSSTTTGTSIFTPPSAPSTTTSQGATSSNVSLLTNFTNAGIVDATMKNNLETVGNASVSTAVVKYGSGSLAFDGTGDYLDSPSIINAQFGTGDLTIEGWLYLNSLAATQVLFEFRASNGVTYGQVYITTGGVLRFYLPTDVGTSNTFSTGVWTHFAITRAAGTLRMFIGGVQGYSASYTSAMDAARLRIGADVGGASNFSGYMDDLRITKGIARYTQNFIPPSVALPRQ